MSINTVESIKLEAMRMVESSRDQQSRQVVEEGPQHFQDKLDKKKNEEDTRVNDPDDAEGKSVNPEGKGSGEQKKQGKNKEKEDSDKLQELSVDPGKGRIIDIVT